MKKYLSKVKCLVKKFKETSFLQVPNDENMEANALARAASVDGSVDKFDEVQYMPSINLSEVQQIEGEQNWMAPIIAYLRNGRLLEERDKVRKLRIRSAKYVLIKKRCHIKEASFSLT